jgi:hypothetical protein
MMSNAEQNKEREELALDALIVAAFKQDDCNIDEAQVEQLKKMMSCEDQAALDDAVGPNFIDSLFKGTVKKKAKKERGALQSAMNRSDKDDDEPPSIKAQEEMDKKVLEEEEKRKAEGDGRQEGRNDRR